MTKDKPKVEELNPAAAQADLENRSRAFNAELIVLLGKYKVGLGAIPIILPNGTLGAQPQLFDDSKSKLAEPEKKEELSKPE